MTETVIGGVGYRWHGDGSFGVLASDALAAEVWPESVQVLDLGYGAIYAAQDIAAAQPARLILIAAMPRGDEPGTLRRYRYDGCLPAPEEILARVREAGAGVIDLDHLLIIGRHMEALPADVVVFEVEPLDTETGIELTPLLRSRLDEVIALVRAEATRPLEVA